MRRALITLSLVVGLALNAADAPQPCAEHRETLSGQIEGRCHGETPLAAIVAKPDTSRVITIDRALALDLVKAIMSAHQQSSTIDRVIVIRAPRSDMTRLLVALHLALGGTPEQRITPSP